MTAPGDGTVLPGDTVPPGSGPVAGSGLAADPTASSIEVIRSEERLRAGVERQVAGVVRVAKRIVTEERTVTVTLRREELVVEHLPAPGGTTDPGGLPGRDHGGRDHGEPALTLTLWEEVPEVTVRAVPVETVRVFVDRVTTEHVVTEDVAREVVEHDVVGGDDRGVQGTPTPASDL